MDTHLGYEKNSVTGNNSGNSFNGSYPKKIQTKHGEAVIPIPHDHNGQFEPIAVPRHESRRLSIEFFSLYRIAAELDNQEKKWVEKYPYVILSWRNNWDNLTVFFQFPLKIR